MLFTDEAKIVMGPFTNDHIRISKEKAQKWYSGDVGVYDLVNRPVKKFEKSLMIAGGVCSYGLSHLMILDWTLNEFAYGQVLLKYKEDIENLNKK